MLKKFALAALAALSIGLPARATLTTTSSVIAYTGNGATTAYSVPFKFLAVTDLVVTVAGVTKSIGTDYSVSGAGVSTGGTVTFSVAPANAAAIVITRVVSYLQGTSFRGQGSYLPGAHETAFDSQEMQIQQLAAGVITPSLATVTANGTGATARALTSKIGDMLSVKDFGAAGDGVTNDTAAIQLAINAANASGLSVYLPGATYKVAGSLTLKSNSALVGAGAGKTILSGASLTAGNHFFIGSGQTDVTVSDMTLSGPGGAVDARGVYVTNCTRCTFTRMRIDSTSYGVYLSDGSIDTIISDNYISNQNTQGIVLQGGSNNHVERNRIDTIGTTALHQGIYVLPSTSNTSGHVITNNNVSNVTGFCIQLQNTVAFSVFDIRVSENNCVNTGTAGSGNRGGIIVTNQNAAGTVRDLVITHNTLDTIQGAFALNVENSTDVTLLGNLVKTYQGNCILIDATAAGPATARIEVAGNTCFSGSSGDAINVLNNGGSGVSSIIIHHNVVDTASGIGINLRAVTDSIVSENRVKDYNSAGFFSNSGISISNTSLRNLINNNLVSTVNQVNTPYALSIGAAADADNMVAFNSVSAATNGLPLNDLGTRTIQSGNKVNGTDGLAFFGSGVRLMTSVYGDGSGYKHKRAVAGCTTAAGIGAVCSTTFTWSSAFADANYTAQCLGNAVTSGAPILQGITAKVGASITVQTMALTAAAAQFTNIECSAEHD